MFKLTRAYEPASPSDGYRVLVERLWRRGVRRQELPLDQATARVVNRSHSERRE